MSTEAQKQDWQDRDFIEIISRNIKKIADFLNHFDQSCRGKLAELNEKITHLERKIDFLEASIEGALTASGQTQQQQQQPKQENISPVVQQRLSGAGPGSGASSQQQRA